ncbi:hypothetical protein, partial [Novilysobacter arseniciresistens]|uniref:hypothetical protein n=1 Tax=Novilysobacter arseniciresistens TaxID=1385522 RepID=UPI001939E042
QKAPFGAFAFHQGQRPINLFCSYSRLATLIPITRGITLLNRLASHFAWMMRRRRSMTIGARFNASCFKSRLRCWRSQTNTPSSQGSADASRSNRSATRSGVQSAQNAVMS